MKNAWQAALLRRDLDDLLKRCRRLPPDAPKGGWIRNVREALGLSCEGLARRMGVAPATIAKMEKSEVKGTIQLSSLRRIARAMDCSLVYAIAPKRSLERVLEIRKWNLALKDLSAVLAKRSPLEYRQLIAAYAQKIDSRRVWKEDPFAAFALGTGMKEGSGDEGGRMVRTDRKDKKGAEKART